MKLNVDVVYKRPKKARWKKRIAEKALEVATAVRDDMRAIVAKHSTTGRENKIEVTPTSEFSYSVGAHDLGLYYLDKGNGGRNSIITPKYSKAMLFVYKGELMVRSRVHGYDGIHFVDQVKRRYSKAK